MDDETISKKAWEFMSGVSDFETLSSANDHAAYCMMIKIYSMYLSRKISKDAAEDIKKCIFIILHDLNNGG